MADTIAVHGPSDRTATVTAGATAREALEALDALRGQVFVARVDGELRDLDAELHTDGSRVEPVRADTEDGRHVLRHSVAHIMAQAVTDLFPDAKFAIGPPITDGFYYDFDVAEPFTPDDLERITARMEEIVREDQPFRRRALEPDEARERFADQPYKIEIIDAATSTDAEVIPDATADAEAGEVITVYDNARPDGSVWSDLCRGPHIPTTRWVPAFALQRAAGAYWRGDEHRPQLQRIYGTAWESRKALKAHLARLEEARKRDHRKLGRELELVHFPEELGPGMAIFLPKGAIVRQHMEDWIRAETLARGYDPVYTPHIAREELWHTSGHLENYRELMFPGMEVDAARYRLKPMNCPFHIMVFASRTRSYRELPLRIAELGTVYRYERSGVVNGLLRARGFTQDDSHIFCRADQVVGEVGDCITFARDVLREFGLGEPSRVAVSTRPADKSIGTDEQWAYAEAALKQAAADSGFAYSIDEGEGAFYGPKIDVHALDAIGREWQLSTIQVDFNLPERFDIAYTGEDGLPHQPFMVHRALFGSIERFFAVLLESTAGAFPTWLAPVQAVVVPVADRHAAYGAQVVAELVGRGLRAEMDDSDDTMGAKIRRHQLAKVPYQLIVGDDEEQARTLSVRPRTGKQQRDVAIADFADALAAEVADRGLGAAAT